MAGLRGGPLKIADESWGDVATLPGRGYENLKSELGRPHAQFTTPRSSDSFLESSQMASPPGGLFQHLPAVLGGTTRNLVAPPTPSELAMQLDGSVELEPSIGAGSTEPSGALSKRRSDRACHDHPLEGASTPPASPNVPKSPQSVMDGPDVPGSDGNSDSPAPSPFKRSRETSESPELNRKRPCEEKPSQSAGALRP